MSYEPSAISHQLSAISHQLHRINKSGLNPVENNNPNDHHHHHKPERIRQVAEIDRAGAQEGKTESLDDRRHRVGLDEGLEALRDGRDRVDHRRGVHQQLHPKLHQEAQIAVFGRQRRDDDAKSEPQAGHHQDQQRRKQNPPIGLQVGAAQREESHKDQEKAKLNAKRDQVRDQNRDRHRQAREIHLAEELRVLHKRVGRLGEAIREVRPDDRAGHIKEELRQTVGGQLGDVAEDDREGDRRQQRLDQVPQRSQDRLLVDRDKIAPDEEHHQVAITPQIREVQIEETSSWFYY